VIRRASLTRILLQESSLRVCNRQPEGAAKLAANPAGEEPASRTCPVATVVIPDGGESDLSCRCSGVNAPAGKAQAASGPSGGLASQQAVAKGANR